MPDCFFSRHLILSLIRRTGPSSSGGHGNLWFSFNVGPIHFASVSSEHNYSIGSPQALWLDADLAAVDRAVTPWIILSLHRPVYSADASEYDSHSPGGALARWLEPVGRAYKVRAFSCRQILCRPIHGEYVQ
jgi:hypothetical protein